MGETGLVVWMVIMAGTLIGAGIYYKKSTHIIDGIYVNALAPEPRWSDIPVIMICHSATFYLVVEFIIGIFVCIFDRGKSLEFWMELFFAGGIMYAQLFFVHVIMGKIWDLCIYRVNLKLLARRTGKSIRQIHKEKNVQRIYEKGEGIIVWKRFLNNPL